MPSGIDKIFVHTPNGEVKYIDGNRETITTEDDQTAFYLLEVPTGTAITLYVDENSTSRGTKDVKATLADAKWVYISRSFWVRAVLKKENVSKFWGDWPNMSAHEDIEKYGIGKQYKNAEEITFTPSNDAYDFNLGVVYWVTAFRYYPEMRLYKQGAYIALLGDPKVTWAYFPEQKKEEDKFPPQLNDGLKVYGDTVELTVFTHLLCDPRKQGHLWSDKAREKHKKRGYEFMSLEINIHDNDNPETPVNKEPIIYFREPNDGSMDYNTNIKISLIISPDWRDDSNHEEEKVKTFYAVIKAYSHYNKDFLVGDTEYFPHSLGTRVPNKTRRKHTTPFGDKGSVLITKEDNKKIPFLWTEVAPSEITFNERYKKFTKTKVGVYDMKAKGQGAKWNRFSKTVNDYVPIPAQWFFKVKWDKMSTVLEKIELDKTNMIAAVGDITYTEKEYDPCGYSKITIREGKRPDFTVFDQEKLKEAGDKTQTTYEIIAGETSKKVEIKVHNLENEDVKCDSILLTEGERHNTLENVFQMGRVIQPQLINNESYVVEDASCEPLPNKKLKGGLTSTEYNKKTDQHKGHNPVAGNVIDGALIQGWISGKDYELKKQGTIGTLTLKSLKYEFNKTYDTNIAKFLGLGENRTFVDSFVDLAWIFRYMFFWQEKHKQTYFIPISTCRYPNQIAKIAVYPKIEWGLDFDFGVTRPEDKILVHKRETLNEMFGLYEDKDDDAIKYNVDIGFVYLIDKRKVEFEISQAKKLLSIIAFALKARSKLQGLIGGSKKSANKKAASKLTGKLAKRFAKLPFSLEILSPAISTGFMFKPMPHEDRGKVPVQAKIYVNANPLFGAKGTLDILAMLGLLPAVGQTASLILALLDVLGIELSFTLSLKGELGLLIEDTFIINELDNTSFNAKIQGKIGFIAEVGGKLSGAGVEIIMGVKEASLKGVGESYLLPMLGAGYNDKGIYIDLRIDFAGLVVKVVGETQKKEDEDSSDSGEKPKKPLVDPDNSSYTDAWILLDPIPELIGKRFYLDRDAEPSEHKADYLSEGSGAFDE